MHSRALKTNNVHLQTRHSPIIVGDRYELAETIGQGGENQSGLLANSDYQAALLSMSVYPKNGNSDMNGYDGQHTSQPFTTLADLNTGRTASDGAYYLYSGAGLSDTTAQATSDQRTLSASNFYQPRSSYASSRSSFDEYGMRKIPEVKEYNPTQGSKGTPVYVFLRAEYDLLAPPRLMASLLFATRRVPARLARLETQGAAFEYCVTADAPNFAETGSSNTQIQLRLQLQEQSGQDAGLVEVGYFQYTSNMVGSSPQEGSRKRKLSMDPNDGSTYNPDDYRLTASNTFAYPQGLHSVDADSLQRRYSSYGPAHSRYYDMASRRGASISAASSRTFLQPSGSQNAPYVMHNSTGRTLALDGPMSSSSHSNPPLIRTSTLQQSNNGPAGASSGTGSFNPYALYPQKAVLKLRGNLNTMTENWTPEECAVKRRLVQFWRSQDKSTINAEFAPVKPEDRQPNSICISCIWWEERQECFATSVDTIYLLEQLVALRFTVEEKNRIRRNLEGFKPLTVAKGKPDSEEFFKVIMGFPNPKPRNIEKDVKVFEWKILAGALKKIMSKYSASYSSTAGALPQTRASIYGGYASDHNAGVDGLTQSSSRSTSGSTASGAYATAQTLKSNTLSPADTANTIPSQYSDQTSLSITHPLPSMGTPNASYVSPHLPMSVHAHQQQYSDQSPISGLSHPYTMPIERSRSSQGPTIADSDPNFLRYAKRPRANTTAVVPMYSSSSSPQALDSSTHAVSTPTHTQAPNSLSNSSVPLPPPTPLYATPSRTYSESQTDLMRSGNISSLPHLAGNLQGEAFPLLGSSGAGGS